MTNLRFLRLRYQIPLSELADIVGISNQHLSKMELVPTLDIQQQSSAYTAAMDQLVQRRCEQVSGLAREYLPVKNKLFHEHLEGRHE